MKHIRIVLFVIFVTRIFLVAAQESENTSSIVPIDEETQLITFREVIEEEGSTKEELFNRCINWLNNYYANPVAVTKIRDFASGKIEGRHQFRITYEEEGYEQNAGMILYTFVIEFKDGRYRYTLTDFLLRQASRYPIEKWLDKSDPAYNDQWNSYIRQVREFTKEWKASLEASMQPEPEVVEEEW